MGRVVLGLRAAVWDKEVGLATAAAAFLVVIARRDGWQRAFLWALRELLAASLDIARVAAQLAQQSRGKRQLAHIDESVPDTDLPWPRGATRRPWHPAEPATIFGSLVR